MTNASLRRLIPALASLSLTAASASCAEEEDVRPLGTGDSGTRGPAAEKVVKQVQGYCKKAATCEATNPAEYQYASAEACEDEWAEFSETYSSKCMDAMVVWARCLANHGSCEESKDHKGVDYLYAEEDCGETYSDISLACDLESGAEGVDVAEYCQRAVQCEKDNPADQRYESIDACEENWAELSSVYTPDCMTAMVGWVQCLGEHGTCEDAARPEEGRHLFAEEDCGESYADVEGACHDDPQFAAATIAQEVAGYCAKAVPCEADNPPEYRYDSVEDCQDDWVERSELYSAPCLSAQVDWAQCLSEHGTCEESSDLEGVHYLYAEEECLELEEKASDECVDESTE